MKIVTYNVNGLRQRISQFGSLSKLLNSFDADIICFQETKLRRQELTSDIAIAEGYESFFSCTRTSDKGRTGYSGVATFCRVKSAFSSTETSLPVSAEEGITGLLNNKNETTVTKVKGLEEFSKDVLLHVDNEGRCMITDHGHFVIFNLYGPRADPDDTERIQFKLNFFSILQKRWEYLLKLGRRIIVVGDLNIAPSAIDRCDAPPDFENNEFRRWMRSMLVKDGGPFFDVFRARHPERRDAYTCWPSNTGAEQFNFGSRIDHILSVGSCLHQMPNLQGHDFFTCHVEECDILTGYKRWKPGNTMRWKGGWNTKLEGSDHAPVYTILVGIPDVSQHDTPSSSSRYYPMIRGVQLSLVPMLVKRQVRDQAEVRELSTSFSDEKHLFSMKVCTGSLKRSSSFDASGSYSSEVCAPNQENGSVYVDRDISSRNLACEAAHQSTSQTQLNKTGKKARKPQMSQLSLRSFFSTSGSSTNVGNLSGIISPSQANSQHSNKLLDGDPVVDEEGENALEHGLSVSPSSKTSDESKQDEFNTLSSSQKVSSNTALLEWRRIQQVMQNSIPLCKGHSEPCVSRVVKKAGPNFGRRFYHCARAEGPSSNPEANCGFFKWASSKTRQRQ